jgi:hypothetical protein
MKGTVNTACSVRYEMKGIAHSICGNICEYTNINFPSTMNISLNLKSNFHLENSFSQFILFIPYFYLMSLSLIQIRSI